MSDQYLGEIRMFSGNYAPVGWAFCDGSILPINGNEALYSLIGVIYGGDGQTTFRLPDLRGRVAVHSGINSKTGTTYSMGQQAGAEKVTLSANELPAHTHVVNALNASTDNVSNPANDFWSLSQATQYAATAADGTMNAGAVSVEGAGQAHNNMMPSLSISFIIALEGLYPSQG